MPGVDDDDSICPQMKGQHEGTGERYENAMGGHRSDVRPSF